MKKVAVIENEYVIFKTMFDALNFKYYGGNIEFSYFPNSQSIPKIADLKGYDLIIMDVNLSPASKLNGLEIINELQNNSTIPAILIFTGYSKTEEFKIKSKLPNYPILKKPATFDELYEKIKGLLPVD